MQWISDDVFEAFAKVKYPATPQMVRYRSKPPTFDSGVDLPPILAAIDEHIARFDVTRPLGSRLDKRCRLHCVAQDSTSS